MTRPRAFFRPVLLSLVALALLIGAAMPKGWMPALAADGSIAITICPEGLSLAEHQAFQAKAQTLINSALGKKEQKPGAQDDGPCAYAMAAHVAMLGAGSPVAKPVVGPATLNAGPGLETTVGQGLAAPPPPARGPLVTS